MSPSAPDAGGMPPPDNPVLTAYEGFVQSTPLVSRYTMTTLVVTYLISWFIDVSFAVSNIPYFALNRLELYRIFLSPLICSSIFTLALAYFSFVDHGKRLEFSVGSAQFLCLIGSLGCVINVAHIVLMYFLWMVTGDKSWAFTPASGIWTILFPLICIECVKSPPQSVRRLFMWTVPTLYYPLVLLGIFSLLGGIQIANALAVAAGYAYGYGHLDKMKVPDARAKQWEETVLANFARRDGWVVGHAATGAAAWNDVGSGGGGSAPGFFSQSATGGEERAGLLGSGATAGGDVFPSGSGRQLGGPTRRATGNADAARAARLKALEGKESNSGADEKV